MQHVRAELADEARLVDHLPDEMRRIEVHADIAAPGLEDAAPDLRRVGDVVPARPFVLAEDHRAVLEGELDAVVARMGDDVGPDLQRILPVGVDCLRGVAAAEGVDDAARPCGRPRRSPSSDGSMTVSRCVGIGMQRVRDSSRARRSVSLFSASDATISLASRRREVARRRYGWCRHSGGVGPDVFGQQAISSASKPAELPSRRPRRAACPETARSAFRASSSSHPSSAPAALQSRRSDCRRVRR